MKRWSLKHGPRPRGQVGPYPCSRTACPGYRRARATLAQAGGQRPEDIVEQEELDASREWLRHVEAGRIDRTAVSCLASWRSGEGAWCLFLR